MNNKDFISTLAQRAGLSTRETQLLVGDVVGAMTAHLEDEFVVVVPSFGQFEVKKKTERIVINPTTRQRMLVPPKLVVNFKSSSSLKDKMQ